MSAILVELESSLDPSSHGIAALDFKTPALHLEFEIVRVNPCEHLERHEVDVELRKRVRIPNAQQ